MLYAYNNNYYFSCRLISLYLLLFGTIFGNEFTEHPEAKRFSELNACKPIAQITNILPPELNNIYLGMEESEFNLQRPNAKTEVDYRFLSEQDSIYSLLPAIYLEKIANSGWEKVQYTIFREHLSELKLITFNATSEEKDTTLRRLINIYGAPNRKCLSNNRNGIFLIWEANDYTIEVSAANVMNDKSSFVFRLVAKGHEKLLSTTKEYLEVGLAIEELEALEQSLLPQLKDLEHIQPN